MIKAIVFDWGDTIMRVFPQYPGPMAEWPKVEAVPGAAEALQALQGKYRLVLATNAADSAESQVRAALRRVGLDEYFELVLLARELGARKPEPDFFRVVASVLQCEPGEIVVVGDDYEADVTGAKQAGMHAIWFNYGCGCSAVYVPGPIPDRVILKMQELPEAVESLAG